MKKFLIRILTFFAIIFLVTAGIYVQYKKLDKSDPYNARRFQSIPSDVKLCNFGSSHGLYGFNYKDVEGIECFNFGFESQTLSYDARIYDYYKENIEEGAVVFIPVSYFSLFGNDECTTEDFVEKNKRYYQILPPELIKNYDIKTDLQIKYPLPSINWIKIAFGKTAKDKKEEKKEFWDRAASDFDVTVVEEDAHTAYERHFLTDMVDENGNRILNHEEIDALKYLIKSCQDRGTTPILITVPYLQEYNDQIKNNDPLFYEEFYALINEIIAETDVAYYDYSSDKRFVKKYEWFINADHLNREGARQFVNILMDEVVYYGEQNSLIK